MQDEKRRERWLAPDLRLETVTETKPELCGALAPSSEVNAESVTSVNCTLDAGQWRLRFVCDCWPSCIQVASIKAAGEEEAPGRPAADAADDAQMIHLFDFVTEVNGETEPPAMLSKLIDKKRGGTDLKLKTVPPRRLTVKLQKAGKCLGLDLLLHDPLSTSILIKSIGAGEVQRHNEVTKEEGGRVCPLDFIESVNGVSGVADEILQEIKAAASIEMVLMRAPWPDPRRSVDLLK